MSTVLHPVGPQRARVYWVRRLLVVLLVVVLATVATTAVAWLRGREDPAAAAASSGGAAAGTSGAVSGDAVAGSDSGADPGAGEAADDEEGAADAGDEEDAAASSTPVDCTVEALQLTLTSSAVEFDAVTNPVLTATVTNVGDEPCTVDAGDVTREVLVTSGDDRVWSTRDCASSESASRQLLLGAGAADAVDIEWARVRSADGCPDDLPAPKPGTYQAVASLGSTTSQTVVFLLG